MPRPNDVVMAKSIYDENNNELLPEALVIKEPDLKESLIDPDMDSSNNPDMDRSNNRSTVRNDSDDCCDCNGCCDDDLLLCCFICYMCND